jgi:hypothetical protein
MYLGREKPTLPDPEGRTKKRLIFLMVFAMDGCLGVYVGMGVNMCILNY